MPQCEDIYERKCKYPIGWLVVGDVGFIEASIAQEAI